MNLILSILLAVTTIGWITREGILSNRVDTAFSAGNKLGYARAFLTKGQMDNILIDAGIDPAKLPR